jgi:hypothetical protein
MMILLFDCMAHADDVVGDACKKHPQPLAQDMNSVSSSFILQFPPVNSALVNTAFSLIQCFCMGTSAKALNSSIDDAAFT